MRRIAAIDIGTNSIHMIVAELRDGGYRVIDREKDAVQLGLGSLDGAPLTPEAIDRGIESLERMKKIAERRHAKEIIAVATSAVREAPNKREFLRRVPLHVRVISGTEEAELIYRAVRSAVELQNETALCIDVGGGSVEIIVGRSTDIHFAHSAPLGALRLAQRFSLTDFAENADMDRCRRFVRKTVRPIQKKVRAFDADVCVATSGTALALAGGTATAHGLKRLRRSDIADTIANLAETTAEERSVELEFDRKRAQTIVAGAIVIDEMMDAFDVDELLVCPAAMREGIVESLTHGTRDSVRRASVLALARRMNCDIRHGTHVAHLAGRIFDALDLRESGRELLEYAALLHETGMHISERGHDRHTDYIVRNGDLKGFTEEQIAIIASVARFYRKDPPDDWNIRQMKAKLTAILRVADGLDRGHRQRVRDVHVDVDDDVVIELQTRGDASVEIESAKKRAKYFRQVFGAKVRIASR